MNENCDDYEMEDTKKFLSNDESSKNDKEIKFSCLSKEEVMLYSTDPAWVRLRWILFALFWIVWFSLLGSAVLIVMFSPKCPYKPKYEWWQKEVVYQVDVEKFKDSSNDGLGDLRGLQNKLGYFKEFGVETLCLRSNILDSANPKQLLAKYETVPLDSFKKSIRKNDLHLILDIPYSFLHNKNESDEVITSWLTNFADGIRITEIPESTESEILVKWTELAEKVGKDTFEKKYISFYPLENAKENVNPSTLTHKFFMQSNLVQKSEFVAKLTEIYNSSSEKQWPSFITGEYTSERLKNFVNNAKQLPIIHGMLLLTKGTPFILYGDELEFDNEDKFMKWDNTVSCGFSKNASVATHCDNSFQNAFSHGADLNLFGMYKKLTQLRKEPSLSWGHVKFAEDQSNANIISFVRQADGYDGYLIAANLLSKSNSIDFKSLHNLSEANGLVSYFYSESSSDKFKIDTEVSIERIILKPGEILVVKLVNK